MWEQVIYLGQTPESSREGERRVRRKTNEGWFNGQVTAEGDRFHSSGDPLRISNHFASRLPGEGQGSRSVYTPAHPSLAEESWCD
jgi:hypothetical protein